MVLKLFYVILPFENYEEVKSPYHSIIFCMHHQIYIKYDAYAHKRISVFENLSNKIKISISADADYI